jgi:hypothetical protein
MKTVFWKALFLGGLVTGLWMALVPNRHGALNNFMPDLLRRWVNEHDDEANMAAFFLLTVVALRLPVAARKSGTTLPAVILHVQRRPLARVAALMLLVCSIEIAQRFIPGRVGELQDVCTGWSGIFAAWMLSVLMDVRAAKSAITASAAE